MKDKIIKFILSKMSDNQLKQELRLRGYIVDIEVSFSFEGDDDEGGKTFFKGIGKFKDDEI